MSLQELMAQEAAKMRGTGLGIDQLPNSDEFGPIEIKPKRKSRMSMIRQALAAGNTPEAVQQLRLLKLMEGDE
jgi:hypothetical protein